MNWKFWNRKSKDNLTKEERLAIVEKASQQVGRAIFFSTIIIIVSFLPVFMLTGQERKLFSPLAWTKTFSLVGSALLAITLVPVLMTIFMKGKLRPENKNPVSNFLDKIYSPILHWCLRWKKTTIAINVIALLIAIPMYMKIGSEFMPPLDEGSILFMPVMLPDVSNTEAKKILQLQDRIIKTVPEVENVLGKAGRAYTATDNAPMSMVETIVLLKPKSEWRKKLTKDSLIAELNSKLQIPGVVNGFTQPIINRINMLSTGIRTDVGVKIYGQNLDSIYVISRQVEAALKGIKGVSDLYVEQVTGGKYLQIKVKKNEIGRYGMTVDDVNMVVESAIGGMNLTTTVEGRQRFNVNLRLAQDYRNDIEEIKNIPIQTPKYGAVPLSAVADIDYTDGPAMINSENAMLRGTVLFNVRGRDLGSTVEESIAKLNKSLTMKKGYYIEWSGQWENQVRANKTLSVIMPIVLLTIFVLLIFIYKSVKEAVITSISVPFALIGGVYIVYFYGINFSVAVAVGFIALLGVAVETGVLMVIYLDEAINRKVKEKGTAAISLSDIEDAVIDGSAKRLRPKLMTVATAMFGLIPILWSVGTGSDVMRPIALPMIGGMITSTIHVLIVTPIIFQWTKNYELRKTGSVKTILKTHV